MRLTAARVGLLALVTVGPVIGLLVADGARIDACLDRGGSYDYARDRCDAVANPPGPAADAAERSASPRDGRQWFVGEVASGAGLALLAAFAWQDRRRQQRSRPVV